MQHDGDETRVNPALGPTIERDRLLPREEKLHTKRMATWNVMPEYYLHDVRYFFVRLLDLYRTAGCLIKAISAASYNATACSHGGTIDSRRCLYHSR